MILAPPLEFAISHALLNKDISIADVDPKSLSQIGHVLWNGIQKLSTVDDAKWDIKGVALYATQVEGVDGGRLQEYLANVGKAATASAADIHRMLRERQALLDVSNEVQTQLASGKLDLSKITSTVSIAENARNQLVSVTDGLVGGAPPEPQGPFIKSLPIISNVTNGIFGLWLVGGLPAVGKSTLALQIGIDVAGFGHIPVLYYDAENGESVTLNRVVKSVGLDNARKLGQRLYIRENLYTLSKDLRVVKPPALIIIDSIQKIGLKGDDKRVALDAWIQRFEKLKRVDGYSVLLVSEIPRDKYTGDPRIDMFKESGALEYAADSAFGLVERGQFVSVWCVKNRHYDKKGQVALIERTRDYWFKEAQL